MYNKDTNMYEGYIYKITNEVNGKIYIGQTITTINKRFCAHKCSARNGDKFPIYLAMNKYGFENFYVSEIEKVFDKNKMDLRNKLNDLEIHYISLYDSTDNKIGYNVSKGGNTNNYVMRKVKQFSLDGELIKIWDSITEAAEHFGTDRSTIVSCCVGRFGTSVGFVWRYVEDDFKTHNTKKQIKRKINKYDIDGNKINSYESISQAARENNCSLLSIIHCCQGKLLSSIGYIWRYEDNKFDEYEIPTDIYPKRKSIKQYSLSGDFIREYKSIAQASRQNNCSPSAISNCCRGDSKSSNGYIWKYCDKEFDTYKV